MRQVPVREWTCSQHKYPDHCEECDTWHCEECRTSKWKTIGYRDATPFEEMMLSMPPPKFGKSFLADAIAREAAGELGEPRGAQVTIPRIAKEGGTA